MSHRHGPWIIQESNRVYEDAFLEVVANQVIRPDGRPGNYATVTIKPGVAVLPVGRDGTTYLVKQFRFALGGESLEAASGGIDEGETPPDAARRELREELGIEAAEWTDLGRVDPDTSIVACAARLYLARELNFTETEREETEAMEVVKIPFGEAIRMVLEGAITHALTCLLILKAEKALSR